jgi:SpoVK/Ycf46/Vps4 family AAA+-type ATPase
MRFAQAQPLPRDDEDSRRSRFITACKEVSAEGASGLAQRIEPSFDLDALVLPPDRKGQLEEIISNIHFAPKVLEGWKFRDQLPYGLGVTALFHGPSGTGKTMAALAVAHRLGVQVLRIDLSRLVSKYIGDTEKNIDRIFLEAQHSGAALLIDEADGLLSRRGEVKDAHDRYANLEVAYLLQRMEGHEGLAILTTNLRQNIDPAFLRRVRFVVDFPRPDATAREAIWRRCLPEESHELDDAMFRQLARKIELTGGSIRQITLRAAFIAAAAGTEIGFTQIAQACRAEYAKLGVPPVELDLVQERRAA